MFVLKSVSIRITKQSKNMVAFLDSLAEQIQNRWCALQTDDIILGGLIAAGSGVGAPALAIAGVVGVARKSSDQICNKSSPTPAYNPPSAPFVGGQCEDVIYRQTVAITGIQAATGNPITFNLSYESLGAFSAPSIVVVGSDYAIRFVAAGNTFDSVVANVAFYTEPPSITAITICAKIGGVYDCSNGAITTCGSIEPEIDPIDEYDDLIDNVPFDDENGDPVNFPDLPVKWFPPCIGLDGLKIPFEITTPLGKICGQVQVKPDIKSGVKPKVDFDLCPSERQEIEPVLPEKMKDYFDLSDEIGGIASPFPSSDYGDIPSLQADNEKPIMGVFIECGTDGTDRGKATRVFNNDDNSNAPTLFIPRLGYVRFWMLAEREEADAVQWSLPIEIKQPRAFIACPSPFGALAVDVQMNDGYQVKYKVAKRKTCCEACEKFDPNAPNDALDRCN